MINSAPGTYNHNDYHYFALKQSQQNADKTKGSQRHHTITEKLRNITPDHQRLV